MFGGTASRHAEATRKVVTKYRVNGACRLLFVALKTDCGDAPKGVITLFLYSPCHGTLRMPPLPTPPKHRAIRSFVRRQGRITRAQQRAMHALWPVFGLELAAADGHDMPFFENQAPITLEIGFGDGEALLQMALAHPERNFIGIEVHRPGVGSLLLQLKQANIFNVRLFCADGVEVLHQKIASQTLDRVHLYFPDPWHKKKHHKRRIVTAQFIDLVVDRLIPSGVLHFATDWQPYAEQALQRLEAHAGLINQTGLNQYAPRPHWRPQTKFERRGQRLGHRVWDILMQKVG